MGMYTEFVCAFELKKETPKEIVNILKYMTKEESIDEEVLTVPNDIFFECERWRCLFTMDSYYFSGDTHSTVRYDNIAETYFVTIRSNLKNYDDEIHKFLKWIKPYIYYYEDNDFLGYSRYEECKEPDLIYISEI